MSSHLGRTAYFDARVINYAFDATADREILVRRRNRHESRTKYLYWSSVDKSFILIILLRIKIHYKFCDYA